MQVNVYSISQAKQLEPASLEDFEQHRNEPDRYYLVDVFEPDAKRLTDLLRQLSAHPLIAERCMDPKTTATVSPHRNLVFVQFPVLKSWNDFERSLLSVICFPRAIFTVRQTSVPALEDLRDNFPAAIGGHEIATAHLLYLLVDRLVDQTTIFALDARRDVESLEDVVSAKTEPGHVGQRILTLKRAMAHFEMNVEEQHRCVTALLSLEADSLSVRGFREYFHDVVSHLEHDLRSVERSEARLSELDQHNILMIQDRTGRRLKILTILSAVFMPLTLITGIYGMNFRYMPELAWRYGYAMVIAVMIGLAAALLWFFYRKNWFK